MLVFMNDYETVEISGDIERLTIKQVSIKPVVITLTLFLLIVLSSIYVVLSLCV